MARSSAPAPGWTASKPIRSPTAAGRIPGWSSTSVKPEFIPAWRDVLGGRYKGLLDLAVITTPDSRLDNFYCEGLAFTLRETGFDGMYIDDTSLGRKGFQRAHRIFEAAGKPLLADMHSWNHWNPTAGSTPSAYCYLQNFPYYHRIWYGEGLQRQPQLAGLHAGRNVGHPVRSDERNARRPQSMARHGFWDDHPARLVRQSAAALEVLGRIRHAGNRTVRLVEPGLSGQDR